MCGIFCHTNFDINRLEDSRNALHTLKHRGPDQWGEWYNDKVYIGHRRLSILDLSENAKQPMTDEKEDVVIAVNGEIYNFLELRNELKTKYNFKSNTDSEVILHGYKEWGIEKLLQKIDGMYSFLIYDKGYQRIFLVRDRPGIKPLYYGKISGKIVCASELKAIEKFLCNDNLTINYTAFYDFLTYRYVPTPKTMYNNIFKLEPGYYLEIEISTNTIRKKQYWKLKTDTINISFNEASERLKELISKSVKEQMISDVPIGFFLSGGIDSSIVVAVSTYISNNINTFSIGFDNHNGMDETQYADLIANKFKTKHHKKILNVETTFDMFPKLREWYDEPFADTSAFPTFLVSKFSREKVTVVLTGDGGDEVFGGYLRYFRFRELYENGNKQYKIFEANDRNRLFLMNLLKTFKNNNYVALIGKLVGKLELKFLLNEIESHAKLKNGMLKNEKERLQKLWNIPKDYDDYWYYKKFYFKELPLLTRLQYLDFHTYLHDDILTKVDRTSMSVSLEARVPLLSKEIIEFLFSLPESIRYYNGKLKGLVKEVYKDIIPDDIINRKKKGFSIPMETWGKKILAGYKNRQIKIINDLFNELI